MNAPKDPADADAGRTAAPDDADLDHDESDEDVEDDESSEERDDEPEAAPAAGGAPSPSVRRLESVPIPAKGRRMTKEDALGPRPPAASHWRCRRIDEGGQRTTLLYHDDGAGIATCEWPIRSCTPEVIRQRWGADGGSFVVQFIHTDERGQRRPCGRSRMLMLSSPAASTRTELAPVVAAPPPPAAFPPIAAGSDSFAQMFSLLAFMQDRDEKVRAAAREEARFANERYKADVELMMERDRLASKERIAQIEATARVAGRAGPAPALDTDLLVHRVTEAVEAKLDEREPEDDGTPTPDQGSNNNALAETLQQALHMFGPALLQKMMQGSGPPGLPTGGGPHGPH